MYVNGKYLPIRRSSKDACEPRARSLHGLSSSRIVKHLLKKLDTKLKQEKRLCQRFEELRNHLQAELEVVRKQSDARKKCWLTEAEHQRDDWEKRKPNRSRAKLIS